MYRAAGFVPPAAAATIITGPMAKRYDALTLMLAD